MSNDRRKPYPFDVIEPRWQRAWEERQTFRAPNPGEPGFDPAQPKYYVLDMFPYPSGSGLHVGHPEGYTATDIIGRYKKMRGFNVLHPMGWDAFGLPAEQHAIRTGTHPAVETAKNVATFKRQLQRLGFGYDWQREVNTTDPGYVKWTQWIFLQIYGAWFNPATNRAEPIATYAGDDADSVRLAYIADAPVNWCPALGTVLANEEVIDGKSEVGGHPVERRPMRQWMLRITAYAQRLIEELDGLDWPESIRIHQRNWIGRSVGAEVHFDLHEIQGDWSFYRGVRIPVFTTRPDTLYGATYMVLSPEHALVDDITTVEQRDAVSAYRAAAAGKSDLERTDLAKDKTGVFTGAFAINPVNGERIPIWIADYVLTGYGTGAIMAVPAHDERDWEFARKFGLPIREVVSPEPRLGLGGSGVCDAEPLECFTGEGFAIHSGPLDGLPTEAAKAEIIRRLEAQGLGRKTIHYKLRDWLFSRQRYWGEPFPIVWENGRHRAVPESELPVGTPELADFKPTGTPEPPLSKAKEWVRYRPESHDKAHKSELEEYLESLHGYQGATRELNTMPQWAGSCWYYLRFCDARNSGRFAGREAERYWMTGRCTEPASGIRPTQIGEAQPAPGKGAESASGMHSVQMGEAQLAHGGGAERASGMHNVPVGDAPDAHGGGAEPVSRVGEPASGMHNVQVRDAQSATPGAPIAHGGYAERASGMATPTSGMRKVQMGDVQAAHPGARSAHGGCAMGKTPASGVRPGGVDLYVGGTEHAVLHLLYARFWHKVLFDLGHVSTPEPFQRLVNQGTILGEMEHSLFEWPDGRPCGLAELKGIEEEATPKGPRMTGIHRKTGEKLHARRIPADDVEKAGEGFALKADPQIRVDSRSFKMSKSRGNVVNPDQVIADFGADSLRLYEMFMGPLEATKPWSMFGVEGVSRFLARVWRLVMEENQAGEWVRNSAVQDVPMEKALAKVVHATVKKVGEDIEALSFNTAIAQMMICTNALTAANPRPVAAIRLLLHVLNPFAPHLAEELWAVLAEQRPTPNEGRAGAEGALEVGRWALGVGRSSFPMLVDTPWPAYDPALLIEDEIELPVQVNGKLRDKIVVKKDATQGDIEEAAKAAPKVAADIAGKTVRKLIVVPGRLVNIVVG